MIELVKITTRSNGSPNDVRVSLINQAGFSLIERHFFNAFITTQNVLYGSVFIMTFLYRTDITLGMTPHWDTAIA